MRLPAGSVNIRSWCLTGMPWATGVALRCTISFTVFSLKPGTCFIRGTSRLTAALSVRPTRSSSIRMAPSAEGLSRKDSWMESGRMVMYRMQVSGVSTKLVSSTSRAASSPTRHRALVLTRWTSSRMATRVSWKPPSRSIYSTFRSCRSYTVMARPWGVALKRSRVTPGE